MFKLDDNSPARSLWSIKTMDWSQWDIVCELISRDWYIWSSDEKRFDEKLQFLYELIWQYAEIHISKHKYSENSKAYWTPQLTRLRKERNKLRRVFRKKGTDESKLEFKSKQKEYRSELTKCKEARIESLLYEKCVSDEKEIKPNVFRLMNKLKRAKKKGSIQVTPDEIIEFYANIGSDSRGVKLDWNVDFKTDEVQDRLLNSPIRYDEVCQAIKESRRGGKQKSFGTDGIHPLMISVNLADILVDLFNQSFVEGKIPACGRCRISYPYRR